jgi:hypothetical protein
MLHQSHSPTSHAAALSIEPNAGSLRAAVLEAIRGATDGLTDEEMQAMMEMNPSTQRPRRVELVRGGFVEDSGRQRPTRSGRGAVVWVVKAKAAGQGWLFD